MTPVFAEPLETEPLRLSAAAVEWLYVQRHLAPTPASPFGYLLRTPLRTSEADRANAWRELAERGLYFGAAGRSTGEGALFARSLEVLARPELHLRVHSVAPGESDARLDLYLSQDAACLGYFDEQGFCIGAPVSRSMLLGALARRLRCASLPPGVEPEAAATGGQVRLLSLVWSRARRGASEPVSEREAVELLTQASIPERDAADALRTLEEAGALIQDEGGLRLAPALARALAALWSGHRVELELRELPPGEADLEAIVRDAERLLFLGPPGERVLCDRFDAGSWEADGAPVDTLLGFEWPSPEALMSLLDELLG